MTPHKITESNPPQFPCWLWHRHDKSSGVWYWVPEWKPLMSDHKPEDCQYAYWAPQRTDGNQPPHPEPTAPTTKPGESTRPVGWPEWINVTERDYTEDASDKDNGCYSHKCYVCDKQFHGNKRRPNICKVCNVPTSAPSKEAMDALTEIVSGREQTMKERAAIIDRHFAPLREENARLTQFHVTLWNAIRRAKSVFDWLDVKNQHKECLPDIESVESALLLTPKESGGYVVMLESDRDSLRDRLARLEAVRLAALQNVALHVGAIPESHIENKRLEHAFVLAAHRILATGEPDSVLKTEPINTTPAPANGATPESGTAKILREQFRNHEGWMNHPLAVRAFELERDLAAVALRANHATSAYIAAYKERDALKDQLTAAQAEIARLKEDHDSCCRLVAEMHAAAVGGVRGPVVGVVEDVSALKQAHADALAKLEEAQQAVIKLECESGNHSIVVGRLREQRATVTKERDELQALSHQQCCTIAELETKLKDRGLIVFAKTIDAAMKPSA